MTNPSDEYELSQQELAAYARQLQDWRQQLQADLKTGEAGTATVALDQQSVGRLSRMDAMQQQQMALEAERRSRQNLTEIDKALKRIELDRFGFCQECEEPINPKRLALNPTATLCIDCASEQKS
ncbi:MAG: TraR/DksA C4-type zinc finger protein [Hydrogenovibrio sp.]|uniref:TraR/DksA family transcriptional regulator n=1 Tax=Hydrogenovibrio sp. TaxID=2065821 RepID=UPI0028706E12|nr:TraR/DksA C4-type zinc finger protein [Hydrogenovibrio sp.]MDR9498257.1 TraR/DksA C4-type zinc finger protein [Hydrogenovibrio sp.]